MSTAQRATAVEPTFENFIVELRKSGATEWAYRLDLLRAWRLGLPLPLNAVISSRSIACMTSSETTRGRCMDVRVR